MRTAACGARPISGRFDAHLPPRAIRVVRVVLLRRLGEWRQRIRTRHALLRLDDHLLRDIGLDRAALQHRVRSALAR